jgi:hypothetical protein
VSTLSEIEKAVDGLSLVEKQRLVLFLVSRLRAQGQPLPPPRSFTRQQIEAWIAEDEAELRDVKEG